MGEKPGTGRRALVAGAGGFIGHHLVRRLKAEGFWVRGVDLKTPLYEASPADEFQLADLRFFENCSAAVHDIEDVYQLAADMGGIGYITANHASLSRNNILINGHMLEASRLAKVERYFYSSSACVYPAHLQDNAEVRPLRETDAIPANPEKGYGWEKLFAEELASYYMEEYGLDARIVRFHNIYGPLGTYEGGREKAPAAISKKVAAARPGDSIEIWGDGQQTRSFCFIGDCVDGIRRIMESGDHHRLNLGSEEVVTVDQLVDTICEVAGKPLRKIHDLHRPQGVRGRNSDNTLLRSVLRWEPSTRLRDGLGVTYSWIWEQLALRGEAQAPNPSPLPPTDSTVQSSPASSIPRPTQGGMRSGSSRSQR